MSRPAVRPEIDVVVPEPPEEVVRRLAEAIDAAKDAVWGSVLGSCVEITVRRDRLHFWSPQLSLQADAHDDGGTWLNGRVGPQPHVWTMFVAVYAALGFITVFALLFSYSQWVLEQPMWALWGVPLGAVIIACVFASARVGQRLGADQTEELMAFLARVLERPRASLEPAP